MTKISFQDYKKSKVTVEEMFENMERYTDMVINKIQSSLIITGAPGVGKSYLVKKRLEQSGLRQHVDFEIIKGRTSPAGLYYALYEHNDKIIVFDDCDSVFRDETSTNILKAALDSYDERIISYISTKRIKGSDGLPLPTSFRFTGGVVFISNLSQSQMDSAVRSRSFVADIEMTSREVIARMKQLLHDVEPKASMKVKTAALKALTQAADTFDNVEISFRSLIKAIRIRQMNFPNWAMMIAEQCVTVEEPTRKIRKTRKTRKTK